MWFGDLYIKPLYLMIALAVIITVVVIIVVKKLIAILVTVVILAVAVYGGDSIISKMQMEQLSGYIDVGKEKVGQVKDWIQGQDIKVNDGDPELRIDGTWYRYEAIRDQIRTDGNGYTLQLNGRDIPVESEDVKNFLRTVERKR